MYTLFQLRRRVDALKRKYALELQVVRVHRLAEDLSRRWVRAEADHEPLPETHAFILQIAANGDRFHTFMNLHRYLERCRSNGDTPDCWGIMRALYADHDLDRISQMVDKCHDLAEPDPDEDIDGLEPRLHNFPFRHMVYCAARAMRRYTLAALTQQDAQYQHGQTSRHIRPNASWGTT